VDVYRSALVVLSAAGRDSSVLDDPVAHARTLVGADVQAVATALIEPWRDSGGDVMWHDDPRRPPGLAALGPAAPLLLWTRGRVPDGECVSIVGSRHCTSYGHRVTVDLAKTAAGQGRVVVSGGAHGIDAAAHTAALSVGGRTVVYLAGGAGRIYPEDHHGLFRRAAQSGAVIWEHPPSVPVRKESFLVRNRLIAATGTTTVVVEAAERSGALNTGRTAADLGRLVLAVPGPVGASTSAGTNRAIADGWAAILLGPQDLNQLLGSLPMSV